MQSWLLLPLAPSAIPMRVGCCWRDQRAMPLGFAGAKIVGERHADNRTESVTSAAGAALRRNTDDPLTGVRRWNHQPKSVERKEELGSTAGVTNPQPAGAPWQLGNLGDDSLAGSCTLLALRLATCNKIIGMVIAK